MNSPIKWRGGKRNLRKSIIPLIPEHKCYVEPFFGAGWVFFGKEKSKVEVINDIDKNLITFFNTVKNDYEEFEKKLENYLISRDEFNYLKELDTKEDDLMTAYKFYYINKNSFGGDMSSFNAYYRDKPYLNDNSLKLLKKTHDRLKNVWIENQDYQAIIKKYDNKDTFFYLDPPYYNTNNGSYEFGKDIDFVEMRDLLKNIKGKFLLSTNENDYLKKVFKDFKISSIDVQYNMSKSSEGRQKFGELLVSNY